MPTAKSSRRWLREHFSDPYVKQAQQEGYRSRAIYKLQELQERDKLFKPGMTVIDLGAAPGGWSQLVVNLVGRKGRVIALDILPMDSIPGVEFIEGDFSEDAILSQLMQQMGETKAGLGDIQIWSPEYERYRKRRPAMRSMELAELAFDLGETGIE